MKNYVNAELEVIKLDEQDVVATSGGGIVDDSGESGWFPDVW